MRSHRRAIRNAAKRRGGRHKLNGNKLLWRYVCDRLLARWSPEQIVRRMEKEYPNSIDMRISAETIYAYLYVLPRGELKRELLTALRHGHKRRHKRDVGSVIRNKPLKGMIGIEERPAEVLSRATAGHWEGDLLIGKNRQSALGTLVERKTRFLLLAPLKSRKSEEVRKAFGLAMKACPLRVRRTLTYDQGREMAEHKLLSRESKICVYFAHPASPWERGTNENTNGLIRQYFPKVFRRGRILGM
ncbi:MAG: IS30 family transposase [Elusimicrobia bacterium]|nr:IS30 family transposase [Elusimicrobiota bacterium]